VSATLDRAPVAPTPARPLRPVVVALALVEARRLLRSPAFWGGVALSLVFGYLSIRFPEDWSGARYTVYPVLVGPAVVGISFAVAGSFHRERRGPTEDVPVPEAARTAGRLLGALSLVAVVTVLSLAGAALVRRSGGFDLGDEPGRTLHAHFSWAEILQPFCLSLLAVAVGAAAGRRLARRATSTLVLFVGWFPFVTVSWAFQSAPVTPYSIIQVQPVSLEIGPTTADPLDFPAHWLLGAPGEFQDHWARLLVSVRLAAGHDLWLLGLAALFVAVALPRGHRLLPATAGVVLAVAGVALQLVAIP
jgi:hypothetical protein